MVTRGGVGTDSFPKESAHKLFLSGPVWPLGLKLLLIFLCMFSFLCIIYACFMRHIMWKLCLWGGGLQSLCGVSCSQSEGLQLLVMQSTSWTLNHTRAFAQPSSGCFNSPVHARYSRPSTGEYLPSAKALEYGRDLIAILFLLVLRRTPWNRHPAPFIDEGTH